MNKQMNLRPIPSVLSAHRVQFALAALLAPAMAFAGPAGGVIAAGQIGITNPSANTTVINQTSQNAVINWQQFNIAGNESVTFNQPNTSAVVLNRVVGGSPSEILGDLSANGRVFIVNPQGVVFGAGAQVDVGGLVASTADIADQDFMAGHYVFTGGTAAPVTNAGNITAAQHGYVVLAGDHVNNSGVIQAKLGTVALASGSAMTLDMNGDGLVNLSVDQAALSSRAGVANLGTLAAQGGTVIMTAWVAQHLASTAVNNSGVVNASGINEQGGNIYLTAEGGDIANNGSLNASGSNGQNGGSIDVRGDGNILLAAGSKMDASGDSGGTIHAVAGQLLTLEQGASTTVANTGSAGKGGFAELSGHKVKLRDVVDLGHGGQLLIDPEDITIGPSDSDDYNQATLTSQLQSGNDGNDVLIIADNSITVHTLTNSILDGRNNGSGAGLILAIGSPVFCDCDRPTGFTPGGTSTSFISFQTPTDTIAVDGNLTLNAGNGSINVGNLLAGGNASLIAGGTIQFDGLTAADTLVQAGSDVTIPGVVHVSDLTVVSQSGNIDLTGSNIVVGTGQASQGGDPGLVSVLANHSLAPTSPKPNASFISDNGVLTLGNSLTMNGDYLYFEGQNIFNPNVALLHSGGALFFQEFFTTSEVGLNGLTFYATLAENYLTNNSPHSNTLNQRAANTAHIGPVLTLAFGSSADGNTQSIDTGATATSQLNISTTTTNFIFATNSPGTVTNAQFIQTSGQVATVLNGTFAIIQPAATTTPQPPTNSNNQANTPQQQASNAANSVSNEVSGLNQQNPNPGNGLDNWLQGNPDHIETHSGDNGTLENCN
ncbi:MAG: filamentous hemagglutinin N-terminal domain-containing protein [Stenotrophobium sp.]